VLRNLLCMLSVALWTAVLFPVACLAMLVTLDAGTSIWVARRLWAPLLLRVAGARVEVEGRAHVAPGRPAIYACNHQSTLDIPVLFVALPANLRFVAKEQLRWVPLVGWYLQLAGHVIVDRGNRQRAIASLDRAAEQILRRRISLIAFPEGTRSRDAYILPFKHGPFGLALKAGVPVVPVTIEGSARIMPRRSWRITPGVVKVRISAPIDVRRFDADDRVGLARVVRETIVQANLDLGGLGGVREEARPAAAPSPTASML